MFCKQNCRNIHIFESYELLFKYLFGLDILNKTVDDKDPPWMSGWNKNCAIKWKNSAYCGEYVRSGDTLFDSLTYLKMGIITNLLFSNLHIIVVVIIVIS